MMAKNLFLTLKIGQNYLTKLNKSYFRGPFCHKSPLSFLKHLQTSFTAEKPGTFALRQGPLKALD